MTACSPDFGRTASDYARHRAGFPPEPLDRLAALDVGVSGARVVDLGTGTGSLARLFAQRGCEVTGVDIALPLLEQARELDRDAGVQVTYVEGDVTVPYSHEDWVGRVRASAPVAGTLDAECGLSRLR